MNIEGSVEARVLRTRPEGREGGDFAVQQVLASRRSVSPGK
jgi:hypothetical protein